MSTLHDSKIGDFTRGGQVTLHFFRMIWQVIQKFGITLLMLYSLVTASIWVVQTNNYERYLGVRFLSSTLADFIGNGASPVSIKRSDGEYVQTTIAALVNSQIMRDNAWGLAYRWLHAMAVSGITTVVLMIGFFGWLFKFGKSQRKAKHLRGGEILEADELTKWLKDEKIASDLKVAGIPIIKGKETTHILLTGSPGTGKSTTIYDLMKRIRERGDRVICYSPSGDFIEWWHRPDKDVILNPFDKRCPTWNLWDECVMPYHYDLIASAMIPPPPGHGDPFWTDAARQLLSSVLEKMHERGNTSTAALIDILATMGYEDLQQYIAGTVAARQIDPKNEKTTGSIINQAVTNCRSLKYLPEDRPTFNIRNWVLNEPKGEDSGQWIFLNAKPDQINSVRPILCVWLELLTNTLMSLPADQDRRIWLIIDELPTLNKINSLSDFLAQSRKYGGCGVLSFQQMSQLKEKYGPDGSLALAGLCATWVCMRQNDPETAKWIANSFGEIEVEESQQGLSYGANDMRDGVSLSTQKTKRELLLPSQISGLNDLEGYVRLPGQAPKGHFKMKRPNIVKNSEAFIAGEIDLFNLSEDPLGADLFDPVAESTTSSGAGRYDEVSPESPESSPSVEAERIPEPLTDDDGGGVLGRYDREDRDAVH